MSIFRANNSPVRLLAVRTRVKKDLRMVICFN
jgi:hypothetical protein